MDDGDRGEVAQARSVVSEGSSGTLPGARLVDEGVSIVEFLPSSSDELVQVGFLGGVGMHSHELVVAHANNTPTEIGALDKIFLSRCCSIK